MTFLKGTSNVLILLDNDISNNDILDFSDAIKKQLNNPEQLTVISTKAIEKCTNSTAHDTIISIFKQSCPNPHIFLEECLRLLKPAGTLIVYESFQEEENVRSTYEKRVSNMKLAGFKTKSRDDLDTNQFTDLLLNIYNDVNNICKVAAEKPSFDIGSSVTLDFGKKKSSNVWKLDSAMDEELIDEDDLLDDNDIVKPNTNLRVCSTTGKQKACKDCSCGLAEELSGKAAPEMAVKSSCGSCYLGDAFRCASCPYLGMPAFKPGEKIVLPENQLKVD